MPPKPMPVAERFWLKADRGASCWTWTGATDSFGYGRFHRRKSGKNVSVPAHRVAFELANGFEPECVMHSCDNPPCVNPDHLIAGTRADNNRDMKAKGRHAADVGTHHVAVGVRHWCAKLTNSDVLAIRAEHNASQRELARRYGVSQRTIAKVLGRIGWKHL